MIYRNTIAESFELDWPLLEAWLADVAKGYGYKLLDLQINFLEDVDIQHINRNTLGHDYLTDIITFDYSVGKMLKVEEYIGWQEILRNAGPTEIEKKEEFARVMVHGLLHCMGFNDHHERHKEQMRAAEEECLILLQENVDKRD